MIVGNGFIAELMRPLDDPEFLIFASGISDPSCVDPAEFIREEDLLLKTINDYPDQTFVYFGTTTPKDSPYAKHKRRMEEMIQKTCGFWVIFRIGPIARFDGKGNTFCDFVVRRLNDGQEFTLFRNESRPILAPMQFKELVKYWLDGPHLNTVISFDGEWMPVQEIVEMLETYFNKKANYTIG